MGDAVQDVLWAGKKGSYGFFFSPWRAEGVALFKSERAARVLESTLDNLRIRHERVAPSRYEPLVKEYMGNETHDQLHSLL